MKPVATKTTMQTIVKPAKKAFLCFRNQLKG